MAYTLNENLKRWAEQYETADFINADPVQIPHRYDSRVNIEISVFVTAWIAWGNRKQIIKKADFIDREKARKDATRNNTRLRAHVIDRMYNTGHWELGKFVVLFAKVLDKVATGYSSSERAFIRTVGMTAFNITMQKLINDEKARNNGNGDDK